MSVPNESELLNRARRFDLQALAEVYDRYSPGLFAYAMRLLGESRLSEDCVAETFSRFLHGLKAGRGPEAFLQAYLYRIAHNWITDQYRRQQPPPLELDAELQRADEQNTEKEALLRLQQEQVRAALRCLTPDQRQVIVLKFIEGWGNEAIASALQKPVGAIKSLQHRALEALRKLLVTSEEDIHETFR